MLLWMVALLVPLLAAGCGGGSARSDTGGLLAPVPFRDQNVGYEFTPPADWWQADVTGSSSAARFVAPDTDGGFPTNINVTVTPADADLAASVAEAREVLPAALTGYRAIIDEPTTLSGGRAAHLLGGTFTRDAGELRNLQLVVVERGLTFIVTATAATGDFARYEPAIRAAFATFILL